MPDITMCLNETCPLRDKCVRHEESGTIPSSAQSYSEFEFGESNCSHYLSKFGPDYKQGITVGMVNTAVEKLEASRKSTSSLMPISPSAEKAAIKFLRQTLSVQMVHRRSSLRHYFKA